jgi:hypothetical protein
MTMRGVTQEEVDPQVVQQLMFNRMVAFVRSLPYEGVTVANLDARTGTFEGSLFGVTFVVSVSAEGVA